MDEGESGGASEGSPGGSSGEGLGHLNDALDDVVKTVLVLLGQLFTHDVLDHGPVVSIIILPVIIIDLSIVVIVVTVGRVVIVWAVRVVGV